MRDYSLTLAQPNLNTALIPYMVQCLKSALQRRKMKKMLTTDDHGIFSGLTGAELRILLALPLSCDILMEAERISFLKARKQGSQ